MVDINLFKEDEEEMEWDASGEENQPFSDNQGKISEDFDSTFEDDGDDFNLDGDDFDTSDDLDGEGFLDDADAVPELEQIAEEDEFEDEDYDFGESKEKKVPVWLILLLGIVVILAALYFLWYQPKMKKIKQHSPAVTQKVTPPVVQPPLVQDSTAAAIGPGDSTQAVSGPLRGQTLSDQPVSQGANKDVQTRVNVVQTVIGNLSGSGQFGSVIVTGNRFFVEYVSAAPNASGAMADKIKGMLNAETVKQSPEERYKRGGKIRYSGVISGMIPGTTEALQPTGAGHSSKTDFVNSIKQLTQQAGLVFKSAKTMDTEKTNIGEMRIQAKVEGNKNKAVNFLNQVAGLTGNHNVYKILMVPREYSDFKADNVKVVIDFIYFQ